MIEIPEEAPVSNEVDSLLARAKELVFEPEMDTSELDIPGVVAAIQKIIEEKIPL